ncbi:MAG: UbiA prenyltransferase family protein [Cyclobacteriaceae bacterium]|nr:UbiA prenyltransferase family protein [Cyclobacteriaceae bacterium]
MNKLSDYISLARPDHWFKNVFMVPGMLFALVYFEVQFDTELIIKIVAGIVATCLIASANYVINEWIDAKFDKFHPIKKNRPSVTKVLNPKIIYIEYAILAILGLAISWQININFFYTEVLLLVMGVLYNVEPIRTKDKAYIDVLSESFNNPIRFALGWFIFTPEIFPPSSMLVAYWMGGAFLMGTKRFSEYRFIDDKETAGLYRKSFKHYTELSLLISVFFYAMTSCFFLGIFLVKNKIELLLSFPFFALLFAWYLKIGYESDSPAQRPEKLYKRKYFMTYVLILSVILVSLLYVKIEFLNIFLERHF